MDSRELQEAYGQLHPSNEDVHVIFPRSQFKNVEEFHRAFGVPVATRPTLPPEDRWELRKGLIQEEFDEFVEAVEDGDLLNAAKELADLAYVVNGTAVEMGIDLDIVVRIVHRSNMSKLDEDGNPIYREDGKVLKGPNYTPPDMLVALGL